MVFCGLRCMNGGECRIFSKLRSAYCVCADGFRGAVCEEKIFCEESIWRGFSGALFLVILLFIALTITLLWIVFGRFQDASALLHAARSTSNDSREARPVRQPKTAARSEDDFDSL